MITKVESDREGEQRPWRLALGILNSLESLRLAVKDEKVEDEDDTGKP